VCFCYIILIKVNILHCIVRNLYVSYISILVVVLYTNTMVEISRNTSRCSSFTTSGLGATQYITQDGNCKSLYLTYNNKKGLDFII
jgi:hypothetical protein